MSYAHYRARMDYYQLSRSLRLIRHDWKGKVYVSEPIHPYGYRTGAYLCRLEDGRKTWVYSV